MCPLLRILAQGRTRIGDALETFGIRRAVVSHNDFVAGKLCAKTESRVPATQGAPRYTGTMTLTSGDDSFEHWAFGTMLPSIISDGGRLPSSLPHCGHGKCAGYSVRPVLSLYLIIQHPTRRRRYRYRAGTPTARERLRFAGIRERVIGRSR